MAGPSLGRVGCLAGFLLFLAGMTSLIVTLARVSSHETPEVAGRRRVSRALEALHPDDVEVLYLSGIFSSIINVTNLGRDNPTLFILLPALEKFENVMVDESRKLRTALRNHELRITYLEDIIARQSENSVQNTQESRPDDAETPDLLPGAKRRRKARIKVTSSKPKHGMLKEQKKKHFSDKQLKETTKSASVDVDIVKNETLRAAVIKQDKVLLNDDEAETILPHGSPDVSLNVTSNSSAESRLIVAKISTEINSSVSLVDATVAESVVENATNVEISLVSSVSNSSVRYSSNTADYVDGVAEYVSVSTDSVNDTTGNVSNVTGHVVNITEHVGNIIEHVKHILENVRNATENDKNITESVRNNIDVINTTNIINTTDIINATNVINTSDVTQTTESVPDSTFVQDTTTRTPVTTELVSIATTSTNPPPTPPTSDFASLEQAVNVLKVKVAGLERTPSYLRSNSKKRIKGLEKRVSEMRRHYRRVRTRLNAQTTKLSGLEILQGIAYREKPRDILEEYEYKKSMLLRFDKLERKLANYRDMVIRNKHQIRDLKGLTSKQDHFITELQSGSDRFEHKTREITINMHGVEQNMGNLYNSLNGYVSDIRWEIRVMLDRVCGDNHLHC